MRSKVAKRILAKTTWLTKLKVKYYTWILIHVRPFKTYTQQEYDAIYEQGYLDGRKSIEDLLK